MLATDSDVVWADVDAALADESTTVTRVRAGREVRGAVTETDPDLVVLDMQIGSMGGVATCLDLRLEESGDRLPAQNILMLLDRDADIFVARRSGADGWLIKPLDSGRLRRAADAILSGDTYDESARTALG